MDNSWGYSDNGGGYGGRQRFGGGGGFGGGQHERDNRARGERFGGARRGGGAGGGRDWEDRGARMGGGGGQSWGGDRGAAMGGDVVTMTVARNHVGRIIGKRGAKIKELESCSGARIKVLNSDSSGPEATIELRGSRNTIQSAEELINELINSSYDYGNGGGGFGGGGGRGFGGGFNGGGRGGGGGGGGGGWTPQEGDETTTIHVGNENLGRIIGKGGSKIKELQMRSGCRIKVMSTDSGPTETPIELCGNPSATRKAEEMITDLISVY